MSCRALHLSFCDGGYLYVHDEARVGRENHQIGWGRWRCEDALHRAAGNLCFQEPRPKCEQDGPSIIGEDLTIRGNVTSKGEIQVDGEIEGDIRCGSLLLGDKSQVATTVVIANSMSGTGKLAMKLRPTVSAWRSLRVQRNSS